MFKQIAFARSSVKISSGRSGKCLYMIFVYDLIKTQTVNLVHHGIS